MTIFSATFAQIATFGAVLLAGVWMFRVLLDSDYENERGVGNSRWVGAVCGTVIVGSICITMGWTEFYVLAPSVAGVGLLAFWTPAWLLQRRRRKRAAEFRKGLVELTVGLANGLRGGGALGQTLAHVARDLRGVVGEEIDLLLDEHRVGVEFAECFENLRKRMPSEDMNLLATAIRLTLSTGGSLAEVLDKMTTMMRERYDFDERLKTMTAQGRFEALAMGLAPIAAFGILFLIDRSMVEPLYLTVIGRTAIGAVLFLELIGFYFINKIVTIEV